MAADPVAATNTAVSGAMNSLYGNSAAPNGGGTPTPVGGQTLGGAPVINYPGSDVLKNPVAPAPTPPVSTTVLSNGNKQATVTAQQSQLTSLSQKGNTTDAQGNVVTSNGEIVPPTDTSTITPPPTPPPSPNPTPTPVTTYSDSQGFQRNPDGSPALIPPGSTYNNNGGYTGPDGKTYAPPVTDTSYQDQQVLNTLDQMKQSTDAITASTISSIQQAFAARKAQQAIVNSSAEGRVQNALLMGGVTGQGSSAQFAPISSSGIIQGEESYGIQQLANLDAEENTAIAAANAAGQAQDYKTMSDKITAINNIRQTKIDAAVKLQDTINANNAKILEQNRQSAIDNAIAGEYSSGTTDPAQIITNLSKKGTNVTAAQVQSTLSTMAQNYGGVDISKLSSDTQEFFALKKIPGGLPVSVLTKGSVAEQLAEYLNQKNIAVAGGKLLTTTGSLTGNSSGNTGAGSGALNAASTLGLTDTTQPLSNVIATYGASKVAQAVIKQEGTTSHPTSWNNPGDIKFANLPGQTDTGVKASDGGTWASYATPDAGVAAVSDLMQKAADKGLTFEQALNAYTNTKPSATTTTTTKVPGTTGSATIDTSTPGYSTTPVPGTGNLTQSDIDQRALSIALGNETAPKAGSGIVGLNNRAINNRVGELNAGGNIASNKASLKALSSTLTAQTKYQANIALSLSNAEKGFTQITSAFKDSGINTSESSFLNSKVNQADVLLGKNTEALRSFQAGLGEVQAEYSKVFAKNGQMSEATQAKANALLSGDISMKDLLAIQNELQAQGDIVKQGSAGTVTGLTGAINAIISPGGSSGSSSGGGSNVNDFLNTPLPGAAAGVAIDWSKAPQ